MKVLSAGNRKPAAECCLYFYGFSGDLISSRDTREEAPVSRRAIEKMNGKTSEDEVKRFAFHPKARFVERTQKVRPSDAEAVSGFIFGVAAMPR